MLNQSPRPPPPTEPPDPRAKLRLFYTFMTSPGVISILNISLGEILAPGPDLCGEWELRAAVRP